MARAKAPAPTIADDLNVTMLPSAPESLPKESMAKAAGECLEALLGCAVSRIAMDALLLTDPLRPPLVPAQAGTQVFQGSRASEAGSPLARG